MTITSSVDFSTLSAKHTSDATKARLRARHWAEIRLKAYGIAAIFLAAAALALLVSTIVTKTANVFYEYYLTLESTIELSDRDRERIENPNPRFRANLRRVVGSGIQDAVGGEVSRGEQRALTGLLSGDAGLELGDRVKADPSLIGQTVSYEALLDDNTQLYLKGSYGGLENLSSSGTLTVTKPEDYAEDEVKIEMGPAALSDVFVALREKRLEDAQRARAEQRRQQNAVEVTEARMLEAESAEDRERLQTQLDRFKASRDRAEAQADQLMEMATRIREIRFTMTDSDPSLLIRAGGGWFTAVEIERGELKAVVYDPAETDGPYQEGEWQGLIFERPEITRPISDRQVVWIENFKEEGKIVSKPNWRIIQHSDSANAELAGIWGAVVGSFWTMVVTFLLAFPIGVMASIYLEEFAPKNRTTDLIEVNINNLAAVPSIVFGLLGLAIFVSGVPVHLFGYDFTIGGFLPRSSPLAGGTVLALMTLPTIIIAGRASIRAVPPSIRDAALGLGASKLQTSTHHVLPMIEPVRIPGIAS
ncbi:MAG: DUF3333 domain-containing protein, partial [Pseudomonadota bacterium]